MSESPLLGSLSIPETTPPHSTPFSRFSAVAQAPLQDKPIVSGSRYLKPSISQQSPIVEPRRTQPQHHYSHSQSKLQLPRLRAGYFSEDLTASLDSRPSAHDTKDSNIPAERHRSPPLIEHEYTSTARQLGLGTANNIKSQTAAPVHAAPITKKDVSNQDTFFFDNDPQNDFVVPSTLPDIPQIRVFPDMHQQAALAKAQAQQQQRESQRESQQHQHQESEPMRTTRITNSNYNVPGIAAPRHSVSMEYQSMRITQPPPLSESLHLPPKPHGPAPVNFRFAHYDPAPPRPASPAQIPTFRRNAHSHMGLPPRRNIAMKLAISEDLSSELKHRKSLLLCLAPRTNHDISKMQPKATASGKRVAVSFPGFKQTTMPKKPTEAQSIYRNTIDQSEKPVPTPDKSKSYAAYLAEQAEKKLKQGFNPPMPYLDPDDTGWNLDTQHEAPRHFRGKRLYEPPETTTLAQSQKRRKRSPGHFHP